jgi:hypothetical protein
MASILTIICHVIPINYQKVNFSVFIEVHKAFVLPTHENFDILSF